MNAGALSDIEPLLSEPGDAGGDVEIERHPLAHAGALHLHDRVNAARQRDGMNLRDRRGGERHGIERGEEFVTGLPSSASIRAMMSAVGTAGTASCSFCSSAMYSGGRRSGRVLRIWPSLMKVVPNSSKAARSRDGRLSASATSSSEWRAKERGTGPPRRSRSRSARGRARLPGTVPSPSSPPSTLRDPIITPPHHRWKSTG